MKDKSCIFAKIVIIISLILFSYLVFIGRNQFLYNMNYTKCIIFMILICLVIYLYGMVVNKEKIYKKNINGFIILYIILLFCVTFIIGRDKLHFYNWWYYAELRIFHTIINQFKYASTMTLMKNICGNAIMLIPLSFLLMIKDKKFNNILRQSIVILPLIIFVEILQAFTHTGSFDIDDIILNYLGTVIFTFLITRFDLINKIRKLFYQDYNLKDNLKVILLYCCSFALVIYDFWLLF